MSHERRHLLSVEHDLDRKRIERIVDLAASFEDGLAAPAQLFDGVTAGGQEGRSGFRNRRERSRSAMLPEVTVVAQSARGPPGAISKPGFLRWGPERPG